MAYRISIEVQVGDHTAKTHKQRITAEGVQQIKDSIREKAPRGSIVKFKVKEI